MTNAAMNTIALPHPRLGLLHVADADILRLLAPLPPFVGLDRYVLAADPEAEPFLWLQAVDQPALCLVVAPHEAVAGPPPEPDATLRKQLGLRPGETPEVYVIVSLAQAPERVTMNLLAPVYVCRQTRRARQVVREGDVALARVPLY